MAIHLPGSSLLGGLLLVTVACAQSLQNGNPESPGKAPDLRKVEQLIFEATNQFRKQEGRGPLRVDPKLTKAAQEFAEYMAHNDKLSHTADGKQPSERTAAQGYVDCIIAENIALDFNSAGFTSRALADHLVDGWKNSPHHRENMLNPNVDEIGVGVALSQKTGRYYAVQDFGRPKSEAIAFKITNEGDENVEYAIDGKSYTIEPRYTITHEECVSPKLTFRLPGATVKEKSFRPGNGSRYLLRADKTGNVTVREEAAKGMP